MRFFFIRCVLPVLSALAVSLPPPSHAGPADARVLVKGVTDTRSTDQFSGRCELELIIMGQGVAQALGIRSVQVQYAVDDTGMILIEPKTSMGNFFQFNEKKAHRLNKKVALKNPGRAARFIRSLKGTVELFYPTRENGGRVVAKGFQARPGRRLAEPALKKWHVQVIYMTREAFEAKKKKALESGQGKGMEKLGEELGEAFVKMFEGLFAGMMPESKHSLHFFVNDPDQRVVALDFLDARGKKIPSMSRANMGELRTFGFQNPPPRGMQLVIYLATPNAVSRIPFSLENIALP